MAAAKKAAAKVAAPKVVAATEPMATREANPATTLPKPGPLVPERMSKRVARSYIPSEKAEAFEEAASHA